MAPAQPRRVLVLLATSIAAVAPLALCACGGNAADPSNASSGAESDEAKAEQFAKCMREHGVEAQVAKGGGGGVGLRITGKPGASKSPQNLEAAQKACARYQPGGARVKLTPAQEAERRDQLFRFAKCMREHGIQISSSETSGGGARVRIEGNVNPESPKFQAAQKACQAFNPKGPLPRGAQSSSSGREGPAVGIGP